MRLVLSESYNLHVKHPTLAKEWHSEKNGHLYPIHVTPGSSKRVWWVCCRGHEWEASVASRVRGSNCPYCSGRKVCDDNCLFTINPKLSNEWHPTKNGGLLPTKVAPNSGRKVWWKCEKGHEWIATIANRNYNNSRCPFCSGKIAGKDNCLAVIAPHLAKEWHPVKNRKFTPRNTTPNSSRKVWWICVNGHEWKTSVNDRRTYKTGCPFCNNKRVCSENSLSSVNSKLLKEWHYKKNAKLDPGKVLFNSSKKVWWICERNHEWTTSVISRVKGSKCPYCTNRKVNSDNCLGKVNSLLAKEWHPTKNGGLSPNDFTPGSGKKVWWKCQRGHEWQAVISSRNSGRRCPYCCGQTSSLELRVYTELMTIFEVEHRKKIKRVECDVFIKDLNIAIEVDGSYYHLNKLEEDVLKNSKLSKSGIKVIRVREKGLGKIANCDVLLMKNRIDIDDIKKLLVSIQKCCELKEEKIGKILQYMSRTSWVNDRYFESLVYMLPAPTPGNTFYDKRQMLCGEWDYNKNIEVTPHDVTVFSNIKVWWICKRGHGWKATVNSRSRGSGCPYCSGNKLINKKSLLHMYPNVAKEWNYEKNGGNRPENVSAYSRISVWWKCKKKHVWKTSIGNRTGLKSNCPYCAGKLASKENCLETNNPRITQEWHPIKNGKLTPDMITPGSKRKVWWLCRNKHEWEAAVYSRVHGNNCPYCSGRKVCDDNCLLAKNPILSKDWHPTKNHGLTPRMVTPGSNKKVWWICDHGHEWQTTVNSRNSGRDCPFCNKKNKNCM